MLCRPHPSTEVRALGCSSFGTDVSSSESVVHILLLRLGSQALAVLPLIHQPMLGTGRKTPKVLSSSVATCHLLLFRWSFDESSRYCQQMCTVIFDC
ncbi:hypothetical protein MPTK1_6g13880 [Marchantia polymorpha subsp. ruderalis]|uniref:Uncharacterized protein n=2 Tax=Marchantia polymorpha TaxID=3197 RepID=A0AAF6BRT4_MARPO|nr:hypothetical protein MARPO_0047s0040 [Marchantia polymorpha]BBN14718.1 hypothetical protein Mp_6g13880 [Marchantia polymorpha subsp. ruderalis]|eukprot:PTQ39057.1 hypothetical protein MARPO_0047s0040 [Marchantia polymorpha]